MFRIISLRLAAAMVAVLAGLCLVVTVLSAVVWAKGGSGAEGMPVLASGFLVGGMLCVVVVLLLRRKSRQIEALLVQPDSGGQR